MKLIGIIADHPTPKATLDEVMFTTGASDSHRGGGYCVVIRREDGADLRSQGMCEYACTERLQTTTGGDI